MPKQRQRKLLSDGTTNPHRDKTYWVLEEIN